MQRQVMMDMLSEFLMVEQGGLQLYHVAASRARDPELKGRYEEFGRQTAHHREVLIRLIKQLGGDPNYVSPTARVAQFKASKLLESSMLVDGLSPEEIEANDLENLLLAETKDHSDWSLLSQMARQIGQSGTGESGMVEAVKETAKSVLGQSSGEMDPQQMRQAIEQAVKEVEHEEDEHVTWAREKLAQMSMRMAMQGPAPSPERWQQFISGPVPPIEQVHPAPYMEGLMGPAQEPAWQESLIARAAKAG